MGDDGRAHAEADAALLEPAHHAVDRFLSEATAAAQHDAVDRADQVPRVQMVEPDDVVGAAAEGDAGHRRLIGEHDGDAGDSDGVGRVADADARDH